MIQIEEDRWVVNKPTQEPTLAEPLRQDSRWQVNKPSQIEEQRTWGDVLARPMESAEKLFTGKLGVTIEGKTPVEHIGGFMKPVAEEAIGLGEAGVSAVSKFAALFPGLTGALGAKTFGGKSWEEAEQVMGDIVSFLGHEPITEKGKIFDPIANAPFNLFTAGLDKLAETALPESPEGQAMLRIAAGVGLVVAGGYLHGSAKTYVKSAAQKGGAAIARAKTLIRKSKDVPPEVKAMVEKIPELPAEVKPTAKQIAEQKMIHEQAGPAYQENLARKMAELKGEKPTVRTPEQRRVDRMKLLEERGLLEKELVSEAEQIAAYEKTGRIEQIKPQETPTRGELSYGEAEIDLTKFHAGYNIIDEIKASVRLLKGEKPIDVYKKLSKKDLSLEPSRTPKTKIPQEELPMPSAGQQIYDALVEAKPLRKEQEALYTKERGKKMATGLEKAELLRGRARAEAFRKAQTGKMEKLQFEPIEGKVPNKAIEEMFDQIWDSPAISEWERLSANEGLAKLLEGKIPQESEIILLDRVFPKSLTKVLMKKRTKWQKVKHGLLEASGIPRAVMASWDVSGPLRQGVFLAPRYPKQFFNSFTKMFRQFGSEKAFKAVYDSITKRETYKYMRRDELALTEMDSALKLREEPYMSHWAEKVPLVRASGRAYSGFLNLLRADTYELLFKQAERLGLDPKKDVKLGASISNFVNVGSGRGSLKSVLGVNLEKSAVILNQGLFSPRLMSSRFKILNPAFYIKAHPFVRKQALQSLLAFASAGTAILTFAKMAGLEVGTEPTSSDFGKIKVGNTRLDIWGGFQQYVRTATQLALGKTTSAETGKPTELKGLRALPYPKIQKGEQYPGAPSQASIIARWASYKQAPVLSFFTDLLKGTTFAYEDIDFARGLDEPLELSENPIAQRFIPMVMQDLMDILDDDPSLAPISAFGLFGVGLQTYKPRGKQKKTSMRR